MIAAYRSRRWYPVRPLRSPKSLTRWPKGEDTTAFSSSGRREDDTYTPLSMVWYSTRRTIAIKTPINMRVKIDAQSVVWDVHDLAGARVETVYRTVVDVGRFVDSITNTAEHD